VSGGGAGSAGGGSIGVNTAGAGVAGAIRGYSAGSFDTNLVPALFTTPTSAAPIAGAGGGASSAGVSVFVTAPDGSTIYYGKGGDPYTSLFGTKYGRGGYSTLGGLDYLGVTLPTIPTSAYGNGQDTYVNSALSGSSDGVVIVYYPINRNLV
jgi:hypothetical protein